MPWPDEVATARHGYKVEDVADTARGKLLLELSSLRAPRAVSLQHVTRLLSSRLG